MHPELAAPNGAIVLAHLYSRLRRLLFANPQIHVANFSLSKRVVLSRQPNQDVRREVAQHTTTGKLDFTGIWLR